MKLANGWLSDDCCLEEFGLECCGGPREASEYYEYILCNDLLIEMELCGILYLLGE